MYEWAFEICDNGWLIRVFGVQKIYTALYSVAAALTTL